VRGRPLREERPPYVLGGKSVGGGMYLLKKGGRRQWIRKGGCTPMGGLGGKKKGCIGRQAGSVCTLGEVCVVPSGDNWGSA